MYSGHIIIQGCQPQPFEGNKYPQLLHLPRLELCVDPQLRWKSQSIIYPVGKLAARRVRHRLVFTQIKKHKEKSGFQNALSRPATRSHPRPCLEIFDSLRRGRGEKIIPPHGDDGWQVKFVSRDWRWMVTEVFILRMEVGVRRGWAPKGTRHWQIHPVEPVARAFSLFWILATR